MLKIVHRCNGTDGIEVRSERLPIDENNSTLQAGSCFAQFLDGEDITSSKPSDDQLRIGYTKQGLPFQIVVDGFYGGDTLNTQCFIDNQVTMLIDEYSNKLAAEGSDPNEVTKEIIKKIYRLRKEHAPTSDFTMSIAVTYQKGEQLFCSGFSIGDTGIAIKRTNGRVEQLAFNNEVTFNSEEPPFKDAFDDQSSQNIKLVISRNSIFNTHIEPGDELVGYTYLHDGLEVVREEVQTDPIITTREGKDIVRKLAINPDLVDPSKTLYEQIILLNKKRHRELIKVAEKTLGFQKFGDDSAFGQVIVPSLELQHKLRAQISGSALPDTSDELFGGVKKPSREERKRIVHQYDLSAKCVKPGYGLQEASLEEIRDIRLSEIQGGPPVIFSNTKHTKDEERGARSGKWLIQFPNTPEGNEKLNRVWPLLVDEVVSGRLYSLKAYASNHDKRFNKFRTICVYNLNDTDKTAILETYRFLEGLGIAQMHLEEPTNQGIMNYKSDRQAGEYGSEEKMLYSHKTIQAAVELDPQQRKTKYFDILKSSKNNNEITLIYKENLEQILQLIEEHDYHLGRGGKTITTKDGQVKKCSNSAFEIREIIIKALDDVDNGKFISHNKYNSIAENIERILYNKRHATKGFFGLGRRDETTVALYNEIDAAIYPRFDWKKKEPKETGESSRSREFGYAYTLIEKAQEKLERLQEAEKARSPGK